MHFAACETVGSRTSDWSCCLGSWEEKRPHIFGSLRGCNNNWAGCHREGAERGWVQARFIFIQIAARNRHRKIEGDCGVNPCKPRHPRTSLSGRMWFCELPHFSRGVGSPGIPVEAELLLLIDWTALKMGLILSLFKILDHEEMWRLIQNFRGRRAQNSHCTAWMPRLTDLHFTFVVNSDRITTR
jgi:hypothetical protein